MWKLAIYSEWEHLANHKCDVMKRNENPYGSARTLPFLHLSQWPSQMRVRPSQTVKEQRAANCIKARGSWVWGWIYCVDLTFNWSFNTILDIRAVETVWSSFSFVFRLLWRVWYILSLPLVSHGHIASVPPHFYSSLAPQQFLQNLFCCWQDAAEKSSGLPPSLIELSCGPF